MADHGVLPRFPFATPPALDEEPGATCAAAEAALVRARLEDGAEVWLATRHESARLVLSDARFSRAASVRPGSPSILPGADDPDLLINMDPPDHSRVRRLVARAFTPQATERRRPRVRQIVDGLLDDLVAQGPPADLVAGLALPLPITVVCDLLGVPYEEVEPVRSWTDRVLSMGAYPIDEIRRAAAELDAYLVQLVAAKRRSPGDDILTTLIETHEGGDRLDERELVMLTQVLIVAGYETTANQLTNSLVALFRHPEQLTLLRSRPELVTSAVEELLRFTRLASAALPRIATADVEMAGTVVPAGDSVFALHYAANRDPDVFAEPDRLDVTRAEVLHLSFGTGPHVCLGAPLARLELQVALAELIRRFPDLALAVPEADLDWKVGAGVRGLRSCPVTWTEARR
jgi:cytochrome P450